MDVSLPPGCAEAFKRAYLTTAWQNQERLEELDRLLPHFKAAGIDVTLLKGMALIHCLYQNIALRPMSDIDLLVPFQHFYRAREILLSTGYTQESATAAWLPLEMVHEFNFVKSGPHPSRVDLHCSLSGPPRLLSAAQMDWFWEQTDSYERNGSRFGCFKPEAQLLHLISHLSHHIDYNDTTLLRFYEIALLIDSSEIDWQEAFRAAVQFQMVLPLQKLLPVFVNEWDVSIPAEVLEQLTRLPVSQRERRISERTASAQRSGADDFITNLMSLPTWKGRLRYARGIIFPPPEYMKAYYQIQRPVLLPFYYLQRWLSRVARS
jgi:hypothetical protein